MSGNSRAILLWVLGAAGAFFLYCAIKGVTPKSLLGSLVNRSSTLQPIGGTASSKTTGSAPGADFFNTKIAPTSLNSSGQPSTPGNNVPPSSLMSA